MAHLWGQQVFHRHLGAEYGAAQVHEHQHAVVAVHRFDGGHDLGRIGAEGAVGRVNATGQGNGGFAFAHLPGQFHNRLAQFGAV